MFFVFCFCFFLLVCLFICWGVCLFVCLFVLIQTTTAATDLIEVTDPILELAVGGVLVFGVCRSESDISESSRPSPY